MWGHPHHEAHLAPQGDQNFRKLLPQGLTVRISWRTLHSGLGVGSLVANNSQELTKCFTRHRLPWWVVRTLFSPRAGMGTGWVGSEPWQVAEDWLKSGASPDLVT